MKLSWTTLENWLSVAGMTALGGAVGYLQANMTAGLTGQVPWKQIAVGALLAGTAAVVHLAQVPPQSQEKKS